MDEAKSSSGPPTRVDVLLDGGAFHGQQVRAPRDGAGRIFSQLWIGKAPRGHGLIAAAEPGGVTSVRYVLSNWRGTNPMYTVEPDRGPDDVADLGQQGPDRESFWNRL